MSRPRLSARRGENGAALPLALAFLVACAVMTTVIIDYTGASPLLPQIFNYLKSGYNAGDWRGFGINSKSAHLASLTPHPTALGYAEASALALGTFDGQSIDGSTIVIRYTWSGDANLDGLVNALDFNALATNFGSSAAPPAPGLGSLVPEPSTIGLIAVAGLALGRRRRRA